jgi:hypothetical protein
MQLCPAGGLTAQSLTGQSQELYAVLVFAQYLSLVKRPYGFSNH